MKFQNQLFAVVHKIIKNTAKKKSSTRKYKRNIYQPTTFKCVCVCVCVFVFVCVCVCVCVCEQNWDVNIFLLLQHIHGTALRRVERIEAYTNGVWCETLTAENVNGKNM
jgi:hypothetical protein